MKDDEMIRFSGDPKAIKANLVKLKRLLELQVEITGIAERVQKRLNPLIKEFNELENDPDPQFQDALRKAKWTKGRYKPV